MTSANVIEYTIYHNGKIVGGYHVHLLCKITYTPLLKYTPINEHTIKEYWYDEDDEYCENDEIPLMDFLDKVLPKPNFNPVSQSWRYQFYKNNKECNDWAWTITKNNP